MAAALVFNREVHTGMALRPSVTTDGLLATAGADGLVRIWDLRSDRLIVEFRSEIDPPVVVFAPDGSYLLYPDQGNIARFYLNLDHLVTLAESRLTRNFTLDECPLSGTRIVQDVGGCLRAHCGIGVPLVQISNLLCENGAGKPSRQESFGILAPNLWLQDFLERPRLRFPWR